MKSKKELILASFQKMDSSMLDVLLEENRTYQEATKELFLEKVEEAFSNFKTSGDVFLIPKEGNCVSQFCPNIGCSGFSFVGNKSEKHMDLIFEILEDEVMDIYHCNGFQTLDRANDLETDNHFYFRDDMIEIDVKKDEEANFKPSVDFLIKQQNCKLAYEEMLSYQNEVIDKELYVPWLLKNHDLFECFGFLSNKYTWVEEFHLLYYRLNEVNDYLLNHAEAETALNDYQNLDKEEELNLLRWLVQYDPLRQNLMLFLYEEIDYEFPEKTPYFDIGCFKIKMIDFIEIAKFIFMFDEHQDVMWKKYLTITEEEYNLAIKEKKDISADYYSLSYHLKRRGIL